MSEAIAATKYDRPIATGFIGNASFGFAPMCLDW
jgi:hypothetical protein